GTGSQNFLYRLRVSDTQRPQPFVGTPNAGPVPLAMVGKFRHSLLVPVRTRRTKGLQAVRMHDLVFQDAGRGGSIDDGVPLFGTTGPRLAASINLSRGNSDRSLPAAKILIAQRRPADSTDEHSRQGMRKIRVSPGSEFVHAKTLDLPMCRPSPARDREFDCRLHPFQCLFSLRTVQVCQQSKVRG